MGISALCAPHPDAQLLACLQRGPGGTPRAQGNFQKLHPGTHGRYSHQTCWVAWPLPSAGDSPVCVPSSQHLPEPPSWSAGGPVPRLLRGPVAWAGPATARCCQPLGACVETSPTGLKEQRAALGLVPLCARDCARLPRPCHRQPEGVDQAQQGPVSSTGWVTAGRPDPDSVVPDGSPQLCAPHQLGWRRRAFHLHPRWDPGRWPPALKAWLVSAFEGRVPEELGESRRSPTRRVIPHGRAVTRAGLSRSQELRAWLPRGCRDPGRFPRP